METGAQTCLIGDFNRDPEYLPTLHDVLPNCSRTGLGAVASIWQGKDRQPTCMVPNADEPTRRDLAFVNAAMLPMVQGLEVENHDQFPVHHPIKF